MSVEPPLDTQNLIGRAVQRQVRLPEYSQPVYIEDAQAIDDLISLTVRTRDFVGDQVKTAKTLKCTFPGEVSIEPNRFLDSGIVLVECPDCARMRSLEPRHGVLRFPSHDKRKTHIPNTDRRWAKGKTSWEVVGAERR
jgi:hypothetical protein